MKNQKNVSLGQIGQISVNVHDLDRAVAFYQDTLGIKHLLNVPWSDGVLRLRGHSVNAGDTGASGPRSSELDLILQGARHPASV